MRKRIVPLLAALLLLAACGETPDPAVTPTAPPAATPVTVVAALSPPPATPSPLPETAPPETPPPATEPPAAETPPPATPYVPPVTPTPAPLADASFADAAFLGNSLVEGLQMFGGLQQGEFFAAESASVVNVGTKQTAALSDGAAATLLDALCETEHGKIYVLFGINEISFAPDYFAGLYAGVVDSVLEREPGAEIYVMSLTPVTKAKNDEGSYFTMEAVNAYNAALETLAADRDWHYLDLVEALAGEDGYLPEKNSTDGIHLTRETYPVWAEYLRTHI